jgi:hypothetical protein
VKHIRADGTFLYYFAISSITGESRGLRFSRGNVASIRGTNPNPEALLVGPIYNLPIPPDDVTETIYDAVAEVVDQHPEVTDLLTGRKTIQEIE